MTAVEAILLAGLLIASPLAIYMAAKMATLGYLAARERMRTLRRERREEEERRKRYLSN